MKTTLPVALACLLVVACNGNDSPTQPTPTTQPTGPVTYNIAAAVQTQRGNPIANAILEILEGQGAGQTFTTDDDGMITLTNAQGRIRIEASSPGCATRTRTVTAPSTSGQTRSATFTLPTPGNVWRRNGTGNNVLDMPRCVDRVRVQGSFNGFCQNFQVRVDGRLLVNEILGTCFSASGTNFNGSFATTGGPVQVENSTGINWTLTEIRP